MILLTRLITKTQSVAVIFLNDPTNHTYKLMVKNIYHLERKHNQSE